MVLRVGEEVKDVFHFLLCMAQCGIMGGQGEKKKHRHIRKAPGTVHR